jgi:hypothetical protein
MQSGVRPDAKQPVYNLTVEGASEFFANGILVHNCHHVGRFPELEEEMTSWVPYPEPKWSPNRMDWLVWAMTDLLIQAKAGRGFISAYAGRTGLLPGGRRREGGVKLPDEKDTE